MATDRLKELLEPLIDEMIIEVLSHLPITEAAVTMLPSESWKDLWTTVPRLHFHSESNGDDLLEFRKFVSKFLDQWKGEKILKLSLKFQMEKVEDSEIDSWLLFAIEKQVEELHLESTYRPYSPPPLLRSCSSIKKLTLTGVEFGIHNYPSIRWNQLTSLSIERLKPYSQDDIDCILTGAPLLEDLNLRLQEVEEELAFRSESLKMLKMDYFQLHPYFIEAVLTIDSPNLESLDISGIWHIRCSLNVPSLKNAILGFDNRDNRLLENSPHKLAEKTFRLAFRRISHVQNLTLNEWSFKLLVDQLENKVFVLFPIAKSLKLYAREAEGIPPVLNIFPALETLVIEQKELPDVLVVRNTILPRFSLLYLKKVTITWDVRDGSIIRFVKFLGDNARLLIEIDLQLYVDEATAEQLVYFTKTIRRILRPLPNVKLVMSEKLRSLGQ